MIKNKKGFTLVELIVVIVLIGVIGIMVFTLVGAGRNQSRVIKENFDAQSEARIAMAYITTSLRQNDTSNGISVGERILIINNSSGMPYLSIYLDDKNLKVRNFTRPKEEDPKIIAKIDLISFSLDSDKRSVSITIDYGNDKHLNSTITLRSEHATGG